MIRKLEKDTVQLTKLEILKFEHRYLSARRPKISLVIGYFRIEYTVIAKVFSLLAVAKKQSQVEAKFEFANILSGYSRQVKLLTRTVSKLSWPASPTDSIFQKVVTVIPL